LRRAIPFPHQGISNSLPTPLITHTVRTVLSVAHPALFCAPACKHKNNISQSLSINRPPHSLNSSRSSSALLLACTDLVVLIHDLPHITFLSCPLCGVLFCLDVLFFALLHVLSVFVSTTTAMARYLLCESARTLRLSVRFSSQS